MMYYYSKRTKKQGEVKEEKKIHLNPLINNNDIIMNIIINNENTDLFYQILAHSKLWGNINFEPALQTETAQTASSNQSE